MEQLILSVVKELKERFLKDGLIGTYHFLRYRENGKNYIRFRLGREEDIDEKIIDKMIREKSRKHDFIEGIETEISPVDDKVLTKVLFLLSEISLTILENKKNIPDLYPNLSGYSHYFLNQLGYNCLEEAAFYFKQELERFQTLLTVSNNLPEKFERIKEIQLKKMDEIKAILQEKRH